MMGRKIALLLTLIAILPACSGKPVARAPESTAPAAPAAPAEPVAAPTEEAVLASQLQQAQALREEGLRLLYAKDPRVKDPKMAFQKLLEAANLGDPLAMDSVGGFYSSGFAGAERNCGKAMDWFEKSAAGGYGLAANNLAYLYVTCDDKKRRDPAKAEVILKMMFVNNPSLLAVLDTYGALLAEQGRFKDAVAAMQVVISLEELIESNPERIDESRKALGLYRKKKKLEAGFDPKPELPESRH